MGNSVPLYIILHDHNMLTRLDWCNSPMSVPTSTHLSASVGRVVTNHRYSAHSLWCQCAVVINLHFTWVLANSPLIRPTDIKNNCIRHQLTIEQNVAQKRANCLWSMCTGWLRHWLHHCERLLNDYSKLIRLSGGWKSKQHKNIYHLN